jgi:hypothetical protein
MLIAPLSGLALVVAVAAAPLDDTASPMSRMTARQKTAAMQPLLRNATDCIAKAVAANPRFARETKSNLGDLIVEAIPTCVTPVRAMIDAYDRYFGDGTGEAFFMGPYLDVLPTAVSRAMSDRAD